jgi:hypothetical protein
MWNPDYGQNMQAIPSQTVLHVNTTLTHIHTEPPRTGPPPHPLSLIHKGSNNFKRGSRCITGYFKPKSFMHKEIRVSLRNIVYL